MTEMIEYYTHEGPHIRMIDPYDDVVKCVREFHQAASQYIGAHPSEKVIETRQRMITEERVELLKEICDLAYVLAGSDIEWGDEGSRGQIAVLRTIAHALDMDFDEAFKAVHQNNMGRMHQDDGTILRREDGKIVKNPNYPKVDLKEFI